ncbi:MAG: signal peptidase I [Candidatus Levybacteria bacterium]|nr:signal peptidase I [Candidatus Levybacteria bacterium]
MKKGKSHSSILPKIIKVFAIVWILSIVVFVLTLLLGTNGFKTDIQSTAFGNSTPFLILLIGSMGIGFLAFGLLILTIIIKIILKKKVLVFKKSFKGILVFGFKLLFLLAIFPLFLLYEALGIGKLLTRVRKQDFTLSYFKPKGIKPFVVRLVLIVTISLTFLPIWVGGYWVIGTITAQQLGYINESISSTGGSMYPTFPEGESITGMLPYPNGLSIFRRRFFGGHEIGRGDVVVVEDDKTRKTTQELYGYPSGWLKRVIAIGGDTLEIRDGIVYLNNQPLKEPYIAKARSTFGQTFLKECSKVTVPENSIFVMGDNRKGSGDSREVGFFSANDVDHVLPLKSQKGDLAKNWRDTSKDFDESSKIKLNKERYLELLNEKRKDVGTKPLKYQVKLEQSAGKRGEAIIKFDDFSYEATKSGYTMEKSMRDAGYSNIILNEAFAQGYYEAEELIEYYFEFPEWKKFLLEKDFQEVGISEVEGELNGCPAQVIVQHFAGYVPPNYNTKDIQGWGFVINDLNNVIPSWEKSRNWPNINKDDLNKMFGLLYKRKNNAEAIYYKMKANQWLTSSEKAMVDEDKSLYEQINVLANKLNGK